MQQIDLEGWLKKIDLAVDWVRQCGYIHRDIKLENIFINDSRLLLGDFGQAIRGFELPCGMIAVSDTKICGTRYNYAPEILEQYLKPREVRMKSIPYTTAVDIW